MNMDTSASKMNLSSNKSTSKIINNIHSMPWLKKKDSTSSQQNSKIARIKYGNDGKIISMKKSNEDFFPGTRDEKTKMKKKKEKKLKRTPMSIDEFEGLLCTGSSSSSSNVDQQQNDDNEKEGDKLVGKVLGENLEEETFKATINREMNVKKRRNNNETNFEDDGLSNIAKNERTTVWSENISTAEKLFPNVQSVVIDRLEEEEMLSRAIAESIATVQLEQLNKLSTDKDSKENRWENLYGDSDDEGGWNNVKRNLPPGPDPAIENVNSVIDLLHQTEISDDDKNNNNSLNRSGGILRKKNMNLNRSSNDIKESDFTFKSCSESSIDDLKNKSLKSVSFNESIDFKIRSNESSDNENGSLKNLNSNLNSNINENCQGPTIDRYGRIDGYSERRLFMGKGARMKEQEYIQNRLKIGSGDPKNQNSESNNSQQGKETIKPLTKSCSEDPDLQKSGKDPKTEEIIVPKDVDKSSEQFEPHSERIEITQTEEPEINIPRYMPKNLQSQETIADIKKEKTAIPVKRLQKVPGTDYQKSGTNLERKSVTDTKKIATNIPKYHKKDPKSTSFQNFEIAAENLHRKYETEKDVERDGDNIEKVNESVMNSNADKPLSKSVCSHRDSTINSCGKSCVRDSAPVEMKPEIQADYKKPVLKPMKNDTQSFSPKVNIERREITVSTAIVQQIKSDWNEHKNGPKVTLNIDKTNNPLKREDAIVEKDTEDLQRNIENQDIMSKNLASLLKVDNSQSNQQILQEKLEPVARCLVPTLIRDDKYAEKISTLNPDYANSMAEINAGEKFSSAACQNLLLAGVPYSDLFSDKRNSVDRDYRPENLNYQNYSVEDSVPFNTRREIPTKPESIIGNGNEIYGTTINQLSNINSNVYSYPPNYANESDKTHFVNQFEAQNLPYEIASPLVTCDQRKGTNFMESREDILQNRTMMEDSELFMENNVIPDYQGTQNYQHQLSPVQAPPGLIKNLKLPPGFTKKESDSQKQFFYTEKKDSPSLKQSTRNLEHEKGGFGKKKSPLRYQDCWHYHRTHWTKPKDSLTAQFSVIKQSETEFRQETGKLPYPILGAAKQNSNSQNRSQHKAEEELQSANQIPKFRRDSFTDDRTLSPNSMGLVSQNNNHMRQNPRNTNSEFDHEGINDPLHNSNVLSQSVAPMICQIADERYPSRSASKWQCNVNLMNPVQVPIDFIHNYEVPVQNYNLRQQNFPPPGFFRPPMYQNIGFQHLAMRMLPPGQMAVHPVPHSLNVRGNDGGNVTMMSPEIVVQESQEFDDHEPFGEMPNAGNWRSGIERSSIAEGAHGHNCENYNLRGIPMGQFIPNSNFFEIEYNAEQQPTMNDMRDSLNARNNETDKTMNPQINVGRGRGRILKRNLL